jgi:hypothetical protein
MTQFQMLMIGLGAIIVVSAFWDQIVSFIPKLTIKKEEAPPRMDSSSETKVKKDPCECTDLCITELTQIVVLWENLLSQCEQHNLQEAKVELEKIFPLLVKVQKPTPVAPKTEGTA